MNKLSTKTRKTLYWVGWILRLVSGIILLPILLWLISIGGWGILIGLAFSWLLLPALILFLTGHYLAISNKLYAHFDGHDFN